MSDKTPLVLDLTTGGPQQLQPTDELDISLNARVKALEYKFVELTRILSAHGIELPETLLRES